MRAKKKDGNHHEIVREFEKRDCIVEDMTERTNFCDILVIIRQTWQCAFIEIKDGRKPPSQRRLTDGEIKFRDKCNTNSAPWYLCESVEDVQYIIREIQLRFAL